MSGSFADELGQPGDGRPGGDDRSVRSRRRVARAAARGHRRRVIAGAPAARRRHRGRPPGAGRCGGIRRRGRRRRPVPIDTEPTEPGLDCSPSAPRRRTKAVAVAATLTFVSATGAAAATGRLPDDLQEMASQMLSKLGITIPSSRRDHLPTRPDLADHEVRLSRLEATSTTVVDAESGAAVADAKPSTTRRRNCERPTRRPRLHTARAASSRPRLPSNRSSRSSRPTPPPTTS